MVGKRQDGAGYDEAVPMSLPSGFWPPTKDAELAELKRLEKQDSKKEALRVLSSHGSSGSRGSRSRRERTLNPNILEAVELEGEEEGLGDDLREIKLEEGPRSKLGADLRPHLRHRTRKIIQSRRITSPITRCSDIVWQEEPSRVLKYRASALHNYGWVPYLVWRNVKATVFGSAGLYANMLALAGWMLIVHTTGLGATSEDIRAFTAIFGTAYVGAIFNVGTLVTFIQGLFVTLVINRWWSMRAVYAQLASHTIDVATIVVNTIRNPDDPDSVGARRARTELIRFLNLGHVLVLTQADGSSRHFASKTAWHRIKKRLRLAFRMPSEQGSSEASDEEDEDEDGEDEQEGVNHTWRKAARDISYQDLADEGLVNMDEWNRIRFSESQGGMARYLLAYNWAQGLLYKLEAEGWVINSSQSLPAMLNKVNAIVDAAGQIFTYINAQMPYPYVHLVSFVVHSYLWVLATYLGALLRGGLQDEQGFVSLTLDDALLGSIAAGNSSLQDLVLQISSKPDEAGAGIDGLLVSPVVTLWNKTFTQVFVYYFLLLAVVAFQGLLDMHTLLDNPFGRHCAKFPLRAQITELMNTCRAILRLGQENREPECYEDIFGTRVSSPFKASAAASGQAAPALPSAMRTRRGAMQLPRGQDPVERQGSADFLTPKGVLPTPGFQRVGFMGNLSPPRSPKYRAAAARTSRSRSASISGGELMSRTESLQQQMKAIFRNPAATPSAKAKETLARTTSSMDEQDKDRARATARASNMSLQSCPTATSTPARGELLIQVAGPGTRSEPASPICRALSEETEPELDLGTRVSSGGYAFSDSTDFGASCAGESLRDDTCDKEEEANPLPGQHEKSS